jgi:hypothetical protein
LARSGEAPISAGLIVKTGYSGFIGFFSVAENILFVVIEVSQVIQVIQMVILKNFPAVEMKPENPANLSQPMPHKDFRDGVFQYNTPLEE